MNGQDIGVGYLNTYVASTVALNLLPPNAKEGSLKAVFRVSASPTWLTADGRSRSRLKVWLTNPDGTPIENARVDFRLPGGNGKLKIIRGVTDRAGLAEADYRAGVTAGEVCVVAEADGYEAEAAITVSLRSDARQRSALPPTSRLSRRTGAPKPPSGRSRPT